MMSSSHLVLSSEELRKATNGSEAQKEEEIDTERKDQRDTDIEEEERTRDLQRTRSGRSVKRPTYLRDYDCT